MKACTTCKIERDDYSPDRRASDGLQSRCLECSRKANAASMTPERRARAAAAARRWHAANKDRARALAKAYREANREEIAAQKRAAYEAIKSCPDFIAKRDAYAAATKDRKREYDREYRARTVEQQAARTSSWVAKNPEKRKAIIRQYKARRRAKEDAGIDGGTLAAWIAEQPKGCFYCGKSCATSFHIDHFIPLAKGGAHVLTNLRIACAPCNLKKNAKMPDEFMREAAA